jgi:hypothetical protein
MKALYASNGVRVDGKLEDSIWEKAPVYPLYLGADSASNGKTPEEAGYVQLAWDNEYFYAAVRFEDSDVVAEGMADQLKHFEMGDLCELFLKPDSESWYWELYVTPRAYKSSFFFPGWGRRGLGSSMDYGCGLKVAAQVDGSLGNWRDRDSGWTAEMAMPIKDLDAQGYPFSPATKWRVLVARYNYSRYLQEQGPELTMTPRLSQTNYHLHPEYGYLELIK